MSDTVKVNGIILPLVEGGAEASIKEYITQNAPPRTMKMLRRRDIMIRKNREELDERIDTYQQSLAKRKIEHDRLP